MASLDCFVCDKPLEDVFSGFAQNQPVDATVFIAYGQYGSGAFDPMDESFLEINICDECLKKYEEKVLICRNSVPVSVKNVVVGSMKVKPSSQIWSETDTEAMLANPLELTLEQLQDQDWFDNNITSHYTRQQLLDKKQRKSDNDKGWI